VEAKETVGEDSTVEEGAALTHDAIVVPDSCRGQVAGGIEFP